jgi:hypothetical protein
MCAAAEDAEDESTDAQPAATARGADDVEVRFLLRLFSVWARCDVTFRLSFLFCFFLGLHGTGWSWWLDGSVSTELTSELLVDRDDKEDVAPRFAQAWLQAVGSAFATGAASSAQGAAGDRAGRCTSASPAQEPRRRGTIRGGADERVRA